MKDDYVYYTGNYYWTFNLEYISYRDKRGKFFNGIRTFSIPKERGYSDIAFRICKRKTE